MHARALRVSVWRGLCGALAALALAMQLLLPPGFMVSGPSAGPPAVVICTGTGPLVHGRDLDPGHAPAGKAKGGGPCALAAHAAGPPPMAPPMTTVAVAWLIPPTPDHRPPTAIVRHLGVPPPARGPPSVPI